MVKPQKASCDVHYPEFYTRMHNDYGTPLPPEANPFAPGYQPYDYSAVENLQFVIHGYPTPELYSAKKNSVVIPVDANSWELNPFTTVHTDNTDIIENLFPYLYTINADATIKPLLIESYSQSEDQKSVTFKLLEGLKWSDGELVKVKDIVTGLEIISNPLVGSPKLEDFSRLDAENPFTVHDDYTIEFHFKEPAILELQMSSLIVFVPYPTHKMADIDFAYLRANPLTFKPISYGPYVVHEHNRSEGVLTLRVNPYWDEFWEEQGRVDQKVTGPQNVVFKSMPESFSQEVEFIRGYSPFFRALPDTFQPILDDVPEAKRYVSGLYKFMYISYNHLDPEESNQRYKDAKSNAKSIATFSNKMTELFNALKEKGLSNNDIEIFETVLEVAKRATQDDSDQVFEDLEEALHLLDKNAFSNSYPEFYEQFIELKNKYESVSGYVKPRYDGVKPHSVLGDVNVRRALDYLIDPLRYMGSYEDTNGFTYAQTTNELYMPGTYLSSQDDLKVLEQDLELAEASLNEAGWYRDEDPNNDIVDGHFVKDGVEMSLELLISASPGVLSLATIYQSQLEEFGIKVDIYRSAEIYSIMNARDYDAAVGFLAPSNFLNVEDLVGAEAYFNRTGYASPEMNALMDEINSAKTLAEMAVGTEKFNQFFYDTHMWQLFYAQRSSFLAKGWEFPGLIAVDDYTPETLPLQSEWATPVQRIYKWQPSASCEDEL